MDRVTSNLGDIFQSVQGAQHPWGMCRAACQALGRGRPLCVLPGTPMQVFMQKTSPAPIIPGSPQIPLAHTVATAPVCSPAPGSSVLG